MLLLERLRKYFKIQNTTVRSKWLDVKFNLPHLKIYLSKVSSPALGSMKMLKNIYMGARYKYARMPTLTFTEKQYVVVLYDSFICIINLWLFLAVYIYICFLRTFILYYLKCVRILSLVNTSLCVNVYTIAYHVCICSRYYPSIRCISVVQYLVSTGDNVFKGANLRSSPMLHLIKYCNFKSKSTVR